MFTKVFHQIKFFGNSVTEKIFYGTNLVKIVTELRWQIGGRCHQNVVLNFVTEFWWQIFKNKKNGFQAVRDGGCTAHGSGWQCMSEWMDGGDGQ